MHGRRRTRQGYAKAGIARFSFAASRSGDRMEQTLRRVRITRV